MNKKWQVLIVLLVTAVIYLGMFVGIPALAKMVPPCNNCPESEAVGSNILDSRGVGINKGPFEGLQMVWLIYLIPGMASGALIATILKKKEEEKSK